MRLNLNIRLLFVNLLAAAGTITSVILTKNFYEVRSGAAGYKSFCNISSTMNCDVVAASRYAELAFGIPLSSFGAGWFLALLLVTLLAHLQEWKKEALRAAFGISLIGSAVSLFYLLIMVTKLKTYCILCLGLDALNLTSFLLLLSLNPFKRPIEFPHWKTIGVTVLISVAVPLVILRSFDRLNLKNSDIEQLAASVINKPAIALAPGDHHPAVGPKSAPITIIEFSDFQCPHCRMGASVVNSVYHRYPGKIRLEFRNFPVDPSCNPLVDFKGHPAACEAAQVALCANRVGKFEEVYTQLFEDQASLAPGKPIKIAVSLGLDEAKLKECTKSREISDLILQDIQEAKALDLSVTPTFYINGHKMQGVQPISSWNRIIEHFLENANGTPNASE